MSTTIDRLTTAEDESEVAPAPEPQPRRPSWHSRPIGYIPALDGMRAVAVALVIAYHLGYSGVAGGYIGVEVFFILSGWLVCALLMNEQQRTGGIALGRVLAPPGPPPAAGDGGGDRGHPAGDERGRPRPAGRAAYPGVRGRHLPPQLAADRRPAVVLRRGRGPVGPRAPVVAVDRGAVLPLLPPAGGGRARPADPRLGGAAGAGPGPRVDGPAPRALRAGGRPVPHLLRHRHPPVRPAARGGARPVLDAQPPAPPRHPAVHPHHGPGGGRRRPRHRLVRVRARRAPGPGVPGGLHRRPAGHARGAGRGRLPGADADRPPAVDGAVAVGRAAVVRHLPDPLARDRVPVRRPGRAAREPVRGGGPGGARARPGGPVVPVPRTARARPWRAAIGPRRGSVAGRLGGRPTRRWRSASWWSARSCSRRRWGSRARW